MNPANASTLNDRLCRHAAQLPQQPAFTFWHSAHDQQMITFAELHEAALQTVVYLQTQQQEPGRLLILLPAGLDYVTTFLGALLAGWTAVTAYPPESPRMMPRLQKIIVDAQPDVVVTTAAHAPAVRLLFAENALRVHVVSADEMDTQQTVDSWQAPHVSGEDLAFLQYSSGSTSSPKGVMVRHRNLMENLAVIHQKAQLSHETVGVFWIPPYHDMGLVEGIAQAVFSGYHTVLMSPMTFIKRPFSWLQAISQYRGTFTGAPNFAFDACVQRITDQEAAQLDLSCLDIAFCGSEPIRAKTLLDFAAKFAQAGLRQQTLVPVYGLAEVTLFAAGAPIRTGVETLQVDLAGYQNGRVQPAQPDQPAMTLVSCGVPEPGMSLEIVNPESCIRCAEDEIGEIWIGGTSIAKGYLNRADESRRVFDARLADEADPLLRTGDLGFRHEGQLYVTGRRKELIILHGRNYYPQDIEQVVESVDPALRLGAGAAFSLMEDGVERLVVMHSLKRFKGDYAALAQQVRRAIAETLFIQPYKVVFIRGSLPKTTSGKQQRLLAHKLFLAGALNVIYEDVLGADTMGIRPLLAHTPYQSATNDIEASLVAIWERVLRVQPVGTHDNFLELGGDSIRATEISAQVESQFQLTFPVTQFLEAPTITAVAQAIATHHPSEPVPVPERRQIII